MHVSLEFAINALAQILPPLSTLERPLVQAYGLTLAQDLVALVDHPNLDDSALDGIACRLEDTQNATDDAPALLHLVGESAAGRIFTGTLERNQAVRIYTGAAVPNGATGIVPVERLEFVGTEWVKVFQPARASDIRRKGSDFEMGQVGLPKGTLLGAAALSLAAAMGHPTVTVYQPYTVALLATGDELYAPGQALPPGGVYNSNSVGLELKLRSLGLEVVVLPPSLDTPEALHKALEGAGKVDLLLTSGGVSMGKYDLVRDLLLEAGEVRFWKVQLKPGGPAICGLWQGLPLFGLPGNPVSSLVVFELIVKPALYQVWGRLDAPHRRLKALASTPFRATPDKWAYWRGSLEFEAGRPVVSDFGNQSSGVLRSLAACNALVVVPPQQPVAVGQEVEVIWL
jgi:molybdopterin molybdotransferase